MQDSHTQNNHGRMNRISFEMENDDALFFAAEGVDPLTSAFSRKTAIHPGMGGIPVEADKKDALFAELMDRERKGKTSAYIHIPFCETHCLYCGFYLSGYSDEKSTAYTDALIEEIKSDSQKNFVKSSPIHTVYFGGGTPTALKAHDLRRLLEAVREYLPLANDCEITIEGRILNFTREKMEACIAGGANRFSLGVQTFDTEIRTSLGRSCSREEIIRSLCTLRDFDNAAVVIDLIYGLPGQNIEKWQADLDTFLELGLDGVDLYQLNIFSGGRLDKAIQEGKLPRAADIPQQAHFFRTGVEHMKAHHLHRLSMSHWGATFRERNLYNAFMKGRAHCIPFGTGAGGTLDGHFCFLERDYKTYMERRKKGEKPLGMLMRPKPEADLVNSLTRQMERGWLNLAQTSQEAGIDAKNIFTPLLAQWEKAGLLTRNGDWADLTLAGQFWQVTMTQALIGWFNIQTHREDTL